MNAAPQRRQIWAVSLWSFTFSEKKKKTHPCLTDGQRALSRWRTKVLELKGTSMRGCCRCRRLDSLLKIQMTEHIRRLQARHFFHFVCVGVCAGQLVTPVSKKLDKLKVAACQSTSGRLWLQSWWKYHHHQVWNEWIMQKSECWFLNCAYKT